MRLWSKSATAFALSWLLLHPTSAASSSLQQNVAKAHSDAPTVNQPLRRDTTTSLVKVLSDHPGRATALTAKQKAEIRGIMVKSKAKGNQNFICTGLSLAGQRESMYRVVRLRAKLVCDYAKSVDPSVKITVQDKLTTARKFNGRVLVVSK